MSYFKPYIDESGLHIPTYNDTLQHLIEKAKSIYGQGLYLGNDSQDYQLISAFAEKISDTYDSILLAYASRSPSTAFGVALDTVVGVNGIRRKTAARSTATLLLEGDPGTIITGGYVTDLNGHIWDLPDVVTLDSDGVAEATGTCREFGVIYAAPDTITEIATPTRGWLSVTNQDDAVVGAVIEPDGELRARQAVSVALPSQSILDGLSGSLGLLPDVTRHAVYENYNDEPDANGISPHSICAVVEGGDAQAIAQAIYRKKGPGCGTYGGFSANVETDDGELVPIHFSRPDYVDIDIQIGIIKLSGFSASALDQMKLSILDYLSTLRIGESLVTSLLWMASQSGLTNTRYPGFSINSILACRHGGTPGFDPINIGFDEVVRGSVSNINVTVQGGD